MISTAAALCRRIAFTSLAAGALWAGAGVGLAQIDRETGDKMSSGFERGMAAFQGRDWKGAIEEMEKVIALCEAVGDAKAKEAARQKLAPVYYTVGAAAYNVPDYPRSIAGFERFVRLFPNHEKAPLARLAIARATFMNKDYAKAAQMFGALEQFPSLRDQSLLVQAECFKEQGKPGEMAAVVEKLLAGGIQSTAHAGAALLLAQARAESRAWDKVEPLLLLLLGRKELVENLVSLNELLVGLGDAQTEKEQFEKATRVYSHVMPPAQVIALQRQRAATLERRIAANEAAAEKDAEGGVALRAQNGELQAELDEARKLLADLEKLPDYMPGLLLRNARCWYGRERKWEAILVYERLLELYPKAAQEREAALFGCIICYADLLQAKTCRQLCAQYLAEFPKGEHAGTVAYVQGAVVLESGDARGAATLLGSMIETATENEYTGQMYLMLAGAHASLGELDQALEVYRKYIAKFPEGVALEEVKYRAAIVPVFQGKYGEGGQALEDFLRDHPRSPYAEDAKYRLMVCKFAANRYDEVLRDAAQWQKDHPAGVMEPEVLSLKGDCLAAQLHYEEAAEAYQAAVRKASTPEVLDYALNEASKVLQRLADWPALSSLWEDFIRKNPSHPNVVAGIYWITKAKSREGKQDEARKIAIDQLKGCLNDRKNESVEMLLQQVAQLCWKRPRSPSSPANAAGPSVSLAPWDAPAELETLIAPLDAMADATGSPRLDYARVELQGLLKKPEEEREVLLRKIASSKPEVLSPQLLALAGEFYEGKKLGKEAELYYNYLKDNYLKSVWLDWAYCGLGNLALGRGDAQGALELYTKALENYTGSKVRDSMMGRGMALLELGRGAEAKKLFEQVAGTREWRGETTAKAVYYLGRVEERENRLAEAVAFYQRVFVGYQKYVPWVEKAYVQAALCFEKLGKRPEAVRHLQEVLRNEKLGFEVKNEARKMLRQWGAGE